MARSCLYATLQFWLISSLIVTARLCPQFGLANLVGLGAALLFLMLLVISNDISLRALGIRSLEVAPEMDLCSFGANSDEAHDE
jgi:hypothetical protein